MRTIPFALLIIVGFLSGCATVYGPSGEAGGIPYGGYSNVLVNANTAIVSFRANDSTPRKQVRTFLIYRCARVTLENGYDYFIMTSSTGSPVNITPITENTYYLTDPPRLYSSYYSKPTIEGSVYSPSHFAGYTPKPHGAVATIKMFKGPKPPGPGIYSALEVIANLGPATF